MKIWLPYVETGSGTDVFTRAMAASLRGRGHEVEVTVFHHRWQYLPWRLKWAPVPRDTNVILANSWNAFSFARSGCRLVSVVHLLVLDRALSPYRSMSQSFFHNVLVRRFERLSLAHADATVAVSQHTAEQFDEYLGRLPRVILNGIDIGFFYPGVRQGPGLDERPMRLLFVGNVNRRKGADLLPLIMERLGEGYELRFTGEAVGDPNFSSKHRLIALGRLDRDQVRDAYQAADLLLFPTRLEGLPLVALEAMACGTPVVASDTGSLSEVVNDGVNGRLCRLDDVEAFAAAIRQLKDSPLRLKQMGEAARRTAERSFSLDRMTDEYVSLFEQLVSSEDG